MEMELRTVLNKANKEKLMASEETKAIAERTLVCTRTIVMLTYLICRQIEMVNTNQCLATKVRIVPTLIRTTLVGWAIESIMQWTAPISAKKELTTK